MQLHIVVLIIIFCGCIELPVKAQQAVSISLRTGLVQHSSLHFAEGRLMKPGTSRSRVDHPIGLSVSIPVAGRLAAEGSVGWYRPLTEVSGFVSRSDRSAYNKVYVDGTAREEMLTLTIGAAYAVNKYLSVFAGVGPAFSVQKHYCSFIVEPHSRNGSFHTSLLHNETTRRYRNAEAIVANAKGTGEAGIRLSFSPVRRLSILLEARYTVRLSRLPGSQPEYDGFFFPAAPDFFTDFLVISCGAGFALTRPKVQAAKTEQ